MDRIINIRVNGHSIEKDSNCAGAQFEANSTKLRIVFSEDWDGFYKTVTFWNALGSNPVKRILDDSLLEDKNQSERIYLVPIAGEAMTESGMFPFTIDGYVDEVRKRTVEDTLKVIPARRAIDEPLEPTPTQAEQLRIEIDDNTEQLRGEIKKTEEQLRGEIEKNAGKKIGEDGTEIFNDYENNTSNIPYSHIEGRSNNGTVRGFYIKAYTANTVTLDSVEGIEEGMPWHIFLNTGTKQERYKGEVVSVSGNVVTVTDNGLPTNFTPSSQPSFFGTFIVNGGSIGTFTVTDTHGEFSCHIEGRENTATLDAHAEGTNTKAFGYSSHAEGRKASALGECSHAEGYGGTAHGVGSHAEGGVCEARGRYSHAEGCSTQACHEFSHAEGYCTWADGNYSHAEGHNSRALGDSSHAEGYGTTASGYYSHAEGHNTKTQNYSAHAEGNGTEASGLQAHAEGLRTKASGSYTHAEGCDTIAEGMSSHAEGLETMALGGRSHAEGYATQATNTYTHAEGHSTHASGWNSHAEGLHTIAASDTQHVQGKYNIEDSSNVYAHIVGNGAYDNARSNAHTLDWSGNGWFAGYIEATAIILKSSTAGSKKRFKITVDDSGALHTEEII